MLKGGTDVQYGDFTFYQREAKKTAEYPGKNSLTGLLYTALGLAGEAGEISNKIKKILRDDYLGITVERRAEIYQELGDLMWYISQMCEELNADLGTIITLNLEKLRSRKERNTIKGSGDTR